MQISGAPAKFNIPWANAAGGSYVNVIPQASQIGVTPGAASLTDGFPPLCFTATTAGGIPPFGKDFNGIMKWMTQVCQFEQAGGVWGYDSTFSSSIGGYPLSALISRANHVGDFWVSTVDNNTSNPDTGGANWVSFSSLFVPVIPATTLYVNNSTGNDSNPGTLTLPFATIQGAINFAAKYQSAVPVTINVAAGTGTMTIAAGNFAALFPSSAITSWVIVGPGAAALTIDASALGCRGFGATNGVLVTISGFTVKSYFEAFSAGGAGANIIAHDNNVIFGSAVSVGWGAYTGGYVFAYGNWTFSGSGYALAATQQGTVRIGYHDVNVTNAISITLSAVTVTAVVYPTDVGLVLFASAYVTWSGTATGYRYYAAGNAVIDTVGQTTTWIPATVAGVLNSGSQYI